LQSASNLRAAQLSPAACDLRITSQTNCSQRACFTSLDQALFEIFAICLSAHMLKESSPRYSGVESVSVHSVFPSWAQMQSPKHVLTLIEVLQLFFESYEMRSLA